MTTFTEDPYDVLGIPSTASDKQIKKAYRSSALKYHPDRVQDPTQKEHANKKFALISHAYEILMDTRLRKEYDRNNNDTDNINTSSHHGNNKTYFNKNETYTPSPTEVSKHRTTGSSNKKGSKGATKPRKEYFEYQFSDPYEIWKRDFKDQFGYDYPGAEYDFVSYDTPIIAPDYETAEKNKHELLDKHGVVLDDKFKKKTNFRKKKKKMFGLFRKSNDNEDREDDNNEDDDDELDGNDDTQYSTNENNSGRQMVLRDGNKDRQLSTQVNGSSTSTRGNDKNGHLAIRNNEQQLDTYTGSKNNDTIKSDPAQSIVISKGRNNRPIAMDVQTKKEGKVTTTITTITRPDGTTETVVMRTGLPKKKKNVLPLLTNGDEKPLLKNDDSTTSDALQVFNQPDSDRRKSMSSPDESKSTALVVSDGVAEKPIKKTKKPYVNPLLKNNALVVKK